MTKEELLEKKLDIATKALQHYADKDNWDYALPHIELFYSTKNGWYYAEEALKEMDSIKMSNFICSECGMTNIDCGGAVYKTPKEIELEKKLGITVRALEKHQKALKEFEQDPMNNLIMLSHQVIYDIYMDTQKTLKEIGLVGTSVKEDQ